jgi:hypothetical protein
MASLELNKCPATIQPAQKSARWPDIFIGKA